MTIENARKTKSFDPYLDDQIREILARLNDVIAYANAGGGAGGDVVGPAGAVADNIATYDGVTGKLIKDGGAKISDLATVAYVDAGTWLIPPIIDWWDPTGGLPVAPDVGDRYGSDATASGWTIDYVYEWDGSVWVESAPEEGWMLWDLWGMMFYAFFSGGWLELGDFLPLDGGIMAGDIDMDGTYQVIDLAAPAANGEAIRATAKITEAALESAVDKKHDSGGDTALGVVGTKNPPIDADLALYRDSTASNALVTSTFAQLKAFLKTYFDSLYSVSVPADGWIASSGTWTPRSQAYTNDPAAGANIELEMADTSGFSVGDVVEVSSSAGTENALITVVHANTHITVAALVNNHTTTSPLVKLADTLYIERAYTNDPAAGNNIELSMADTSGFAVGDLVNVSSSAGNENATVTVVDANVHITVNTLALNHTTTSPMVKQVIQNTFIVDTSGDLSATLEVGQRIKFTDTTTKYFILVGISTTRLTLYGGTDYSVVSTAAVTNPYYSIQKAPFGFPLSPAKWTIEYSNISDFTQASPTAGTWYNIGSPTIAIPVGIWDVRYSAYIRGVRAANGSSVFDCAVTLSTANNSESDVDFTTGGFTWIGATSTNQGGGYSFTKNKILSLSSKTPYYLNSKQITATAQIDTLVSKNSVAKLFIRAVCVYL